MDEVSVSDLLGQISLGLDAVEAELFGATPGHGRRVAIFSLAIGRALQYPPERLFCLGGSALLHDNALTEYILSEHPSRDRHLNMKTHCILGQENCRRLPFPQSIGGFILYHHECADGSGAFSRQAGGFPEEAGIIALADRTDVRFHLQRLQPDRLDEVRRFLKEGSGTLFLPRIAEAAMELLDGALLESMRDDAARATFSRELPPFERRLTNLELMNLSAFTAKIIDYKSRFTRLHTTQIASKAWRMGGVYGYDESARAQFYQAAALHDVGKLLIPTAILEKPGALTKEEFEIIKSHARYTWELLEPIRGLSQIAVWAADHHEKLDGSGYPFGKRGEALDFNSRLLACLDIYQAVSEPRPYHDGRSHRDTMEILYQMAGRGQIDGDICRDLDREFVELEDGNAPDPLPLKI